MIFASLPLLALAARGVMADAASAADEKNIDVSYWIGWCWVSLVGSLLVYQIVIHLISYIRQVSCLNNDTQRYFFKPDSWYAATKKYLISAPLFRTRHHREFKLSAALNVGTLPSRLQTIFLVSYIGANAALTVIAIDFTGKEKTIGPILRNRSGTLAVLNMLPLFLLAGRNNPLIKLCGITFDTFNLVHRWIGRIVVFEAVVHTLAWLVPKVHQSGWAVVAKSFQSSEMIISGIIATSAFLFILIASPSIVRHAFYEVFLHLHILCAALAIGALWYHLSELWHIKLLYGVIALWCAERFTRFATLIYRNIGGKKNSKATVEILPGEALRVTLAMARPWDFRPGQHVYLYLPSVGWWMSHPFSLAWSEEATDLSDEKGLVMNRQDILEMNNSKTEMSLIVRCRTGFTKKLYNKADKSPKGVITTSCLVEGPYGGESLTSYGTVMLFAAGVGITHQVPHVRDLVASYANGTAATRRVTLVWIIQSPEHLEWIRPWMTTILAMPKRRDILKIQLFVTRPRSTREIHSPSASVQMFPGKPNVQSLIDNEMQDAVGAGCVSVCGTGSLADDVRRAVRRNMGVWNVDFREESFSW